MSFITSAQLGKLLNDYGPTVAFIVLLILALIGLFLLWKPLSKFVTVTNNIIDLPTRLDNQDKLLEEKKELLESLQRDLSSHVKESEKYVSTVDVLKRQVDTLLQQQEDIVHEVKPNSGTSMKDQLNRTEILLKQVLEQMEVVRVDKQTVDEAATQRRTSRARRRAADSSEES